MIKNKFFDLKLGNILIDFYETEYSLEDTMKRIDDLYNSKYNPDLNKYKDTNLDKYSEIDQY